MAQDAALSEPRKSVQFSRSSAFLSSFTRSVGAIVAPIGGSWDSVKGKDGGSRLRADKRDRPRSPSMAPVEA
jgi:hypothetical protein